MSCKKCESTETVLTMQLIRTASSIYKYVPQIRRVCENGYFLQFVKQTPEVIERLNIYLTKITHIEYFEPNL